MWSRRWKSSSPAANTASFGTGMPITRRSTGPAICIARRWMGKMRSSHQRPASGSESRRTVSPVGAASTTMTSYAPLS